MGVGEGLQKAGPGIIEMWGAPSEHGIQSVSQKGGVQSQALAAGECCLVVEGKEERVEAGGRAGPGPGTGQKTNRSHSPHFQGCRCWGMCFGYPDLYLEGHCCRRR